MWRGQCKKRLMTVFPILTFGLIDPDSAIQVYAATYPPAIPTTTTAASATFDNLDPNSRRGRAPRESSPFDVFDC